MFCPESNEKGVSELQRAQWDQKMLWVMSYGHINQVGNEVTWHLPSL